MTAPRRFCDSPQQCDRRAKCGAWVALRALGHGTLLRALNRLYGRIRQQAAIAAGVGTMSEQWTDNQVALLKRANEVCKFLHTEPSGEECQRYMDEHDICISGVPSAPEWQLMRYVGLHISAVLGQVIKD